MKDCRVAFVSLGEWAVMCDEPEDRRLATCRTRDDAMLVAIAVEAWWRGEEAKLEAASRDET
jgi:hypothetical protein